MIITSTIEALVVSNFINGKCELRREDTKIIKERVVIRIKYILAFLTVLVPFFAVSFKGEEEMAWSAQSSFLFITKDKKQHLVRTITMGKNHTAVFDWVVL